MRLPARGRRAWAAQNRQRVGDGPYGPVAGDPEGTAQSASGREIGVTSGTSEVLVDQILAGDVDIAFVSLPVDVRGIKTERLSDDGSSRLLHRGTSSRKQRTIESAYARGERLILGERGGNTRRLIDQFFAQAGVTLHVAMELSRQQAIRRMVEADLGVGIVPAISD